ncbi:hypothetical protein FY557_17265 [Chryseobacterium sp. SN22]|uniref:hypothetical protein n=1 Tax=Chryseobacterium sp. SN22 TaxID=2606431 RepID=UPI0011F017CE|nr:hypothetical protein [Chryseobacterium sp. SN22]KAA0126400.1 hypothetical protein FY557_17265 [Chryseobacterium sp. SN22]
MKTVKFILSAAIVALTVYSCSSDRDEEVKTEPAAVLELKPLKVEEINNQGTAKIGDTIIGPKGSNTIGTGLEPTDPSDPNDPEIIPPGDVKPPKGK